MDGLLQDVLALLDELFGPAGALIAFAVCFAAYLLYTRRKATSETSPPVAITTRGTAGDVVGRDKISGAGDRATSVDGPAIVGNNNTVGITLEQHEAQVTARTAELTKEI